MKRRRCARVCGAITVLFGSVVTVGVLLSAPQPSLAAIITSVGGDLTVVPQPTNLIYGNTIFSGITSPTPIIFNEYTNHMIPVFSAPIKSSACAVRTSTQRFRWLRLSSGRYGKLGDIAGDPTRRGSNPTLSANCPWFSTCIW